jgi:hypothetical protein
MAANSKETQTIHANQLLGGKTAYNGTPIAVVVLWQKPLDFLMFPVRNMPLFIQTQGTGSAASLGIIYFCINQKHADASQQ